MVSKIIEDITKKSLELQLSIRDFPINLELNANICGLRLAYSTEIYFKKDQLNQIEQYVRKFSLLKLSKIFHYILAEKHIVVVCKSRKSLNQLF
jgi:ribosomal protein L18E